MFRKAYTPVSLFLQAVLLLVVGILLVSAPQRTIHLLTFILILLSWFIAGRSVIGFVVSKEKSWKTAISPALLTILALYMIFHAWLIPSTITRTYGLWLMLNAVIRVLYLFQLFTTHSRGKISTILKIIAQGAFALVLQTRPYENVNALARLLGYFFLLSAFLTLLDFVRELLGTDYKGKRIRQHLRLKPPVLLTAIMPMALCRMLDDPNEQAEAEHWTRREVSWTDQQPNLEIFLHLAKNVAMGFGHMDIALDGKVYAYGCYDGHSNRLFGILSDGVLFTADRDAYVEFSKTNMKKRLLAYGVVLTDEQKAAVREKAASFLADSTRWYPSDDQEEDKAMERECGAEYYKIGKGPYKTYNVLTTNCVAVANMLTASSGVDLMNPQGIITPGTYSEFLDRQFRRKNSIVVSRTLY